MIGYAISKNHVKIRLTEERWFHISESHDYMSGLSDLVLETVNKSEEIIKGNEGELIALQRFNNKYIVVTYKEVSEEDGFIITSFLTSEVGKIRKNRIILWKNK